MGFLGPIFKAIAAALAVWQQERAIRNNPAMIKNSLDIAKQQATDAVRVAEATLANPNSTPQQHADALRALREAAS